MNMSSEDDLKNISAKLDTIAEDQKATTEKVSAIRERLFDPDHGIYTRIKDLKDWATHHEEEESEQKEKYKELHKDLKKTLESIEPLSDDYKIRMSRKKWIDMVVYLSLTVVIGIVAKNVLTIDDIHVAAKKERMRQHDPHSVVITKINE